MSSRIIAQGAEAVISLENNQINKHRIKKSYRITALDEKIRKLRTRSEAKLLEKASKIIPIPKIIKVNEKANEIIMENIEGKKLSEHLDYFPEKEKQAICTEIGKNIAKLHNAEIIHGDVTTSNMIWHNNQVYFIDFGLGFHSKKPEDKAVDLHVLKEALEARHFQHWEKLLHAIIEGYKSSKHHEAVLHRLKVVEQRGRYKDKY